MSDQKDNQRTILLLLILFVIMVAACMYAVITLSNSPY